MASTSAPTLLTTLPCFSSARLRCGDGRRVWRVNGSRSGGLCDGCQNVRARVCAECAHSRCCSVGERGLRCYPSGKGLRKRGETVITRVSFDVAYEFEDAFSSLSLRSPPEPVLFPRKMLNLKFAVLLMRSAYEAVDALDFIPMDKFQVKVS